MTAPIHVAITRRVLPGREDEFVTRLRAFADRSLAEPGVQGVYLLSPPPGSSDYGILRSFASAEAKETFYASSLYRDWQTEVETLVAGPAEIRELHGLEAFFAPSVAAQSPAGPPRWKMALATWLGVNLVTTPLLLWVMPLIVPWAAFPWNNFILNAPVVALLTWVVMPPLTRALSGWLNAPAPTTQT